MSYSRSTNESCKVTSSAAISITALAQSMPMQSIAVDVSHSPSRTNCLEIKRDLNHSLVMYFRQITYISETPIFLNADRLAQWPAVNTNCGLINDPAQTVLFFRAARTAMLVFANRYGLTQSYLCHLHA